MSKSIVSKPINMQILRAAAAIAVVLYHVGVEKSHICADVGGSCAADLRFGIDGVRLFFMISGYIMVVSSWNAFGKPGASWKFIQRRVQRIVPLYWIMTTLGVIGIALAPSMLTVPILDPVILPILRDFWRRTHAAVFSSNCRFSFCAGVMPPNPMLGRSLL